MKYIDEFRDKGLIKRAAAEIKRITDPGRRYVFMEVCGTHTMSIARFGLKDILPGNIELLSGPGCPVCVTPTSFIDTAIAYSRLERVLIATFGDMVKVPGTISSLEKARAQRGNIKIVYSALDALKLALNNPEKKVIFLGVGFETTAPTVAASIKEADREGAENFFVLCGHKVMPPALRALIEDERLGLDGFILPAHVSAIIGSRPYSFISDRYKFPGVIAGFEPLDIMQGIYMLVRQISENSPRIEIQYNRVVHPEGNKAAQEILGEVFHAADAEWRGLGVIPKSGFVINKAFSHLDSEINFKVNIPRMRRAGKGCICGEVLKGLKTPRECRLFFKACTPEHPVGPCMVSSEGACSAYYLHK